MVDHDVHGVALLGQEVYGGPEQYFGPGEADGGKDDKSRVDVAGVDEGSKVSGVLRHEDMVAFYTPSQYLVVGCTENAKVAWMLRKVHAFSVEISGDARGQALVEKQAHRWGGWGVGMASGGVAPGSAGGSSA